LLNFTWVESVTTLHSESFLDENGFRSGEASAESLVSHETLEFLRLHMMPQGSGREIAPALRKNRVLPALVINQAAFAPGETALMAQALSAANRDNESSALWF